MSGSRSAVRRGQQADRELRQAAAQDRRVERHAHRADPPGREGLDQQVVDVHPERQLLGRDPAGHRKAAAPAASVRPGRPGPGPPPARWPAATRRAPRWRSISSFDDLRRARWTAVHCAGRAGRARIGPGHLACRPGRALGMQRILHAVELGAERVDAFEQADEGAAHVVVGSAGPGPVVLEEALGRVVGVERRPTSTSLSPAASTPSTAASSAASPEPSMRAASRSERMGLQFGGTAMEGARVRRACRARSCAGSWYFAATLRLSATSR